MRGAVCNCCLHYIFTNFGDGSTAFKHGNLVCIAVCCNTEEYNNGKQITQGDDTHEKTKQVSRNPQGTY